MRVWFGIAWGMFYAEMFSVVFGPAPAIVILITLVGLIWAGVCCYAQYDRERMNW